MPPPHHLLSLLLLLPLTTANTATCSGASCTVDHFCNNQIRVSSGTTYMKKDLTLTSDYCGGPISHTHTVIGELHDVSSSECFDTGGGDPPLGIPFCAKHSLSGGAEHPIFRVVNGGDLRVANQILMDGRNAAAGGGGVVVQGGAGGARASFVKCVFHRLHATTGGVAEVTQNGYLVVVESYMASNLATVASYGGAIRTITGGKTMLVDTFYDGHNGVSNDPDTNKPIGGASPLPCSTPEVGGSGGLPGMNDGWCAGVDFRGRPACHDLTTASDGGAVSSGIFCGDCIPSNGGKHWDFAAIKCATCPSGFYCPDGAALAVPCPAGFDPARVGNTDLASCYPGGVAPVTTSPTLAPTAAPTTPTREPTAAPTTLAPTASPTAAMTTNPTSAPTAPPVFVEVGGDVCTSAAGTMFSRQAYTVKPIPSAAAVRAACALERTCVGYDHGPDSAQLYAPKQVVAWPSFYTGPAGFPQSPEALHKGAIDDRYTCWAKNPTTAAPTAAPTTLAPTAAPTTLAPTAAPTASPTTFAPTAAPTTFAPTAGPTAAPTTRAPTASPTASPTAAPTTLAPTAAPTTRSPTPVGTTLTPTAAPTTLAPTAAPTTRAPSQAPTTQAPTQAPVASTTEPTGAPTEMTAAGHGGGKGSGKKKKNKGDGDMVALWVILGILGVAGVVFCYRSPYDVKSTATYLHTKMMWRDDAARHGDVERGGSGQLAHHSSQELATPPLHRNPMMASLHNMALSGRNLLSKVKKSGSGGGSRGLAEADALALPPHWKEVYSPPHKRAFYHNTKTKESSWTRPGVAKKRKSSRMPAAEQSARQVVTEGKGTEAAKPAVVAGGGGGRVQRSLSTAVDGVEMPVVAKGGKAEPLKVAVGACVVLRGLNAASYNGRKGRVVGPPKPEEATLDPQDQRWTVELEQPREQRRLRRRNLVPVAPAKGKRVRKQRSKKRKGTTKLPPKF